MSTDDARGLLAEALHERLCTDDFTRGEPSCGICEDDAAALLTSPQLARLIEQREAAARAEAWDEGYDARGEDIANEGLIHTELTPNPYRVASPGSGDADSGGQA